MFNFQGSELMIILLLALVILGPEKLPEAMRRLGRFYADLKKMSSGFQDEFRAAVDEPMRELRETANTIRDSADFRKLQDGERTEKPTSARMAPADPDAVPTDDVPFRDDATADAREGDAGATDTDHSADPADEPPAPEPSPFVQQTSTPPPPPPPFSSSQAISAAPRRRDSGDDGTTSPAADRAPSRQVAVDDEHGLREARPAPDAAGDEHGRRVADQVAVADEGGLREARPAAALDEDGAA